MTVSTTTSGVTRTGDGVTLEFSFSFEARLAAEIFVSEIVGLVLVAVDPADYVVAIEPDGVGGTVTFTVAPDDGANLYIDAESGSLLAVRTLQWRVFDFMWGLHIMDLQTREDSSHAILIGFAGLSLISLLMAFWLLIVRQKRKSAGPVR